MLHPSRLLLFGVLGCLGLRAPNPTKLEWKPKVGSSHFYKVQMSVTSSAEPSGFTASAEMKQTIESIDDDGKIIAKRRWSKFAVVVKGDDSGDGPPTPPDSTVQDTFAPNGDLIDEVPLNEDGSPKKPKKPKSDEGDDADDGDETFVLPVPPVIYPTKEVDVGATWSVEDPDKKGQKHEKGNKSDTGPSDPGMIFTFAGEEPTINVSCYRIDVDTKPGKDPAINAYGHMWISKDDGSLVQARLKLKGMKEDKESPELEMEIKVDLDD